MTSLTVFLVLLAAVGHVTTVAVCGPLQRIRVMGDMKRVIRTVSGSGPKSMTRAQAFVRIFTRYSYVKA